MALPDSLKIVAGTQIVLANTGEYSPTQGQPARTDQIDLGNITNGAYRQSAKFDFTANRAVAYEMTAYIELFSSPTAGTAVNFFMGYSSSATAANDNPANLSGSDAAYNGYGAAAADADEAVLQLDYIGSLLTTADTDIHVAHIGMFTPPQRYGMLVVHNDTGIALAATDAIETAVAITPIEYQVQD